ncbi:hypothetical protein D3C75_996500 [compost metagenome]
MLFRISLRLINNLGNYFINIAVISFQIIFESHTHWNNFLVIDYGRLSHALNCPLYKIGLTRPHKSFEENSFFVFNSIMNCRLEVFTFSSLIRPYFSSDANNPLLNINIFLKFQNCRVSS